MPPRGDSVDLASTIDALVGAPISSWPDWRCVAVESLTGSICAAPATLHVRPIERSATTWTYCTRHAPAGAVPIPQDSPFSVTRLELRVAVTGAPGDLQASADEAVRRIVYAIQSVGGLVTGLRVPGRRASQAPPGVAVGRLLLAGRPEPLSTERSSPGEAPGRPLRRAWWKWRTG